MQSVVAVIQNAYDAPAGWSATNEGNARLPLVYNIKGKLMLHDTIRNSPKGLIVPENNYTGLGNFGFMHLPGARLTKHEDFVFQNTNLIFASCCALLHY